MKKILYIILLLIICIPFGLYVEKIEKINRRDAELLQQNIKNISMTQQICKTTYIT